MYVAGIDAGSAATKAVILADGRLKAAVAVETGEDAARSALLCMEKALREAKAEMGDIACIAATGCGREKVSLVNKSLSDTNCLARGIRELAPRARTIVDVGGKDFRVLRVDESGQVTGAVINDRCASGTGRFLQLMSEKTGVDLEDFGRMWCQAREPVKLESSCTVFIASEVEGLMARGVPVPSIIRAVCEAVAERIACVAREVGVEPPVALVGGVSQNPGVRKALERCFSCRILVPPMSQFTAAYGAALLAWETERSW